MMWSIGSKQMLYYGLMLMVVLSFSPMVVATPKSLPKMLLVIPNTTGFPFWQRVKRFSHVVSHSLGVELHTYYIPFDNNHDVFSHQGSLTKLVREQIKPDFMISLFWFDNEIQLLELSQQYKLPLITFNTSLTPNLTKTIGRPREKYPYWLAHLSPDDIITGQQLAQQLITKLADNKPANLLAIAGDGEGWPSENRLKGLNKTLLQNPQIKLLERVNTDWSSFDGRKSTTALLKRHGKHNIRLIWAAGDFLALGAVKAIESHGLVPGKDILVGGIDWNKESFEPIRSGQITVSLGGHFIEGGKAIILAYDKLHGHDFTQELAPTMNTEMAVLDKRNIDSIEPKISYNQWKTLDFKHLSKAHNPQLKHYKLSLADLLQFNEQ